MSPTMPKTSPSTKRAGEPLDDDCEAKRLKAGLQHNAVHATHDPAHAKLLVELVSTPAVSFAVEAGPEVFVCHRKTSVIAAWNSLCSHKFHSFPVLQQDKNKWYGFVDVLDIIKYVIDNDHFGAKIGDESSLWKAFPKFVAELPEFSNKTVNDVMVYPLSRRNPFHPIVNTLSLFTAVEAMARIPNLHRVPIVDEDRKLKAILTQSNVINWLHQRLDMLGAKGDIQVKNMRGVLRDVKSVSEVEHKAIDAFNLMVSENVTGVAVTNKNGELVETISAVDLKTLATDGQLFWRLYQKIPEFLKHLKADWAKDHRPHDVVSATPESTLRQVICILAEKQVHRLFIVDDNKKPVGVISLRDVLSAVLGF